MSDDIITRLRGKEHGTDDKRCEACDGFCCHCELCDCCLEILEVCLQAADEIERLRANLKQWQALCDTYYAKLVMETDNTSYFIQGYRFLASGGK